MNTLEDGYFTLYCSNCEAPLCEIFIYRAEGKPNWQGSVRADCCHCGNKSYRYEINGRTAFSSTEFTRAFPEPDERDATKIIVQTETIKKWT